MGTTHIDWSADLPTATRRCLDTLAGWARACIARYTAEPPSPGHDALSYTTGWEPWLHHDRPADAIAFLKTERDRAAANFRATGAWRHGYWRTQEAHHGTEHYQLFLACLERVAPDPETRRQLFDATEHLGNWSPEVPAWFDWDTGLFKSLWFGADGTGDPAGGLNVADHLRGVGLALLAYDLGGGDRYLDLAVAHGRRWAAPVATGDYVPAGLLPAGPIAVLDAASDSAYHAFAGMAGNLVDDRARTENILASGGIECFLRLAELAGDDVYRQAAARLLDIMVPELADPDATVVAAAVRAWRHATGDGRYDDAVRAAAANLDARGIRTLGLEPRLKAGPKPPGFGKRTDLPIWRENGEPRRHNPGLLALAAELDDDPDRAAAAVDLARSYLELAIAELPDGRPHGCGAASVNAVAHGHGRDNNAGMATAVLAPFVASLSPLSGRSCLRGGPSGRTGGR